MARLSFAGMPVSCSTRAAIGPAVRRKSALLPPATAMLRTGSAPAAAPAAAGAAGAAGVVGAPNDGRYDEIGGSAKPADGRGAMPPPVGACPPSAAPAGGVDDGCWRLIGCGG